MSISGLLDEARSIVVDLPVFWEVPPERAQQIIALLRRTNSDADVATFGYKLRTGGVTADAFPASAQISEALVTPATHQLPIKFTAGLHHPIRQFRDEVKTKMHGFLNVLGAAVPRSGAPLGRRIKPPSCWKMKIQIRFRLLTIFFAWREWRIDIERLQISAEIRDVVRQLQL